MAEGSSAALVVLVFFSVFLAIFPLYYLFHVIWQHCKALFKRKEPRAQFKRNIRYFANHIPLVTLAHAPSAPVTSQQVTANLGSLEEILAGAVRGGSTPDAASQSASNDESNRAEDCVVLDLTLDKGIFIKGLPLPEPV